MNVGRKLMLIVVTSVVLVTIPAAAIIYQYAKQQLIASEEVNLLTETNAQLAHNTQNFAGYELSLGALSKILAKDLAAPPQASEAATFDRLVMQYPDKAWRSRHKNPTIGQSGQNETAIFLDANIAPDAQHKSLCVRSKHILDIFSSSINSATGNVWLLTRDDTFIIYDNGYPNYVFDSPATADVSATPWLISSDPVKNPERRLRWTAPTYDAAARAWLVSASMPLDVNGQWLGNIGKDFKLNEVLPELLNQDNHYTGEQQFLLDANGRFIVAGPWQKALEASPQAFKPNLSQEPDLVALLGHKDSHTESHLFSREITFQGLKYLPVDTHIDTTGWHYFRLVPTNTILAPLRQLFYKLVAMVLAIGLLVGLLIETAVKRNIVNRLQTFTAAVRSYGAGNLEARAQLEGDDEIAKIAQEFNAMADKTEATLQAIPDMLFDWGLDGTYYSVHMPTDDYLGVPSSELVGKTIGQVLPLEQAKVVMAALQEANETGFSQGKQYQRITSHGLKWFELSVAKKAGGDENNPRFMALSRNITERKLATEEIQNLAFYDHLTQLPNRRLLLDRLHHALASSARSGRFGAIMFLDLDNFKTLNDSLGHHIGDQLLQHVATRLTECLREGDTVARLGGDEYVVILEDLSDQDLETATQAESIANKILAALNQPYMLAGRDYHSTSSIGVTLFNDHNAGVEELLRQADIAMYQAKKAGRNTMRFFNSQMQDNISSRIALETELRLALEQQQFQLHYQIQVDKLGAVLGAEALIRWAHPEQGLLMPAQFIPLAEETGLILPIGDWVLETACAQIKAWQQQPNTCDLVLSMNVSAKQFHQEYFAEQVEAAVLDSAINPTLLKFELTESMLLEDSEGTIATMNTLKKIGVQFSLDDFGTGYSSLQYLKRLPLNQLKIDQSFVRDIVTDTSDQAIVHSIIAMAQTFNLDVIAEGVETSAQKSLLQSCGCTHFQGFLFGRPAPMAELEALLK